MKQIARLLNILGVAIVALYLLGALLTAPKLDVTNLDKEEAISRIERTANGKDASLVARPFLSVMMNAINVAKTSLLISCGVVFVTGVILFLNILKRSEQTQQSGVADIQHKI